jgi:hypothetical protein
MTSEKLQAALIVAHRDVCVGADRFLTLPTATNERTLRNALDEYRDYWIALRDLEAKKDE